MRQAPLRPYIASQVSAYFGDHFYIFALPWIMIGEAALGAEAAIVLAVAAAGAGLFYRLAGSAISTLGPLQVQLLGQCAAIVAFLLGTVALFVWPKSVLAAAVVALVAASVQQFARPAGVTLLANMVPGEVRLRGANTTLEYGQAGASVVVPIAAGFLVTVGLNPALLLALSAVFALPLLLVLHKSIDPSFKDDEKFSGSIPDKNAKPSGGKVPQTTQVRALLAASVAITFGISSFAILIPVIVGPAGAFSTGLAFGVFGIGFVAGGLVIRLFSRFTSGTLCAGGLIIMACGDAIFAFFGGTALGVCGLLLSGIGMMPTRVGLRTLVQITVLKDQLGAVASAQIALALATRPASLVFTASILAVGDARLAVAFFAGVLALSAVLVFPIETEKQVEAT